MSYVQGNTKNGPFNFVVCSEQKRLPECVVHALWSKWCSKCPITCWNN